MPEKREEEMRGHSQPHTANMRDSLGQTNTRYKRNLVTSTFDFKEDLKTLVIDGYSYLLICP